jgi:hypothetical protein
MAYTVKPRTSYRWPVEHVIEIRQGKPERMVFDAEFKAIGQARVEALLALGRTHQINDDQFFDEVLVDLHELVDEGGKPYCKADLPKLREQFPGLYASLSKSWTDSVLGVGAAGSAVRKN